MATDTNTDNISIVALLLLALAGCDTKFAVVRVGDDGVCVVRSSGYSITQHKEGGCDIQRARPEPSK